MTHAPLWLTDRTRYGTGTGRCRRERYLQFHAGPTGYGLVRRGEAIPLATGTHTHLGLETLFHILQREDRFPTVEEIRAACQTATAAYEALIEQKGFRGMLQSERSEYIVAEQTALVTGLIWAACRTVLPWIHREYKILEVEVETIYVLDCSCGLTAGVQDQAAHEARGCTGIGQQLRQDVIAAKRQGGGLAYFEAKTTGYVGDAWSSAWETKPQLAIGTFGLFERYQREVTETYILGLYKGARKTRGEGEAAIKVQDSPLCYGKRKAGNPPLAQDEWKPAYEWVDDQTGATMYARRPYESWPIWELPQSDWPTYHASLAADPSLTPSTFWVSFLPQSVLEKQVFLVGPLNPQVIQAERLKRQIVGEERQWQDILWKLWEFQQTASTPLPWRSQQFQAELDRLVPASWDCRRYGAQHECQYTDLCFQRQGWESFEGYVPRIPHHLPEKNQAVSRGLLPPDAREIEEDE